MITKVKTQKEVKTPQIGIRLEPELFEKLKKIAEEEYRPLANVVRIAVTEYLERKTGQAA